MIGVTGDPVNVVVKFVVLRPLTDNQPSFPVFFLEPLKVTLGLCLGSDLMHMVVMDYIDARLNTPLNAPKQIRAILTLLHSDGYVFGDLRKQNILFDADGKVKFIDFNWCG